VCPDISSSHVLKTEINGYGNSLRWLRNTLYPQRLALTSPTSGGRSVGIVRLRTMATEFSLVCVLLFVAKWISWMYLGYMCFGGQCLGTISCVCVWLQIKWSTNASGCRNAILLYSRMWHRLEVCRRFGRVSNIHLQSLRVSHASITSFLLFVACSIFVSTLEIGAACASETTVLQAGR
jgi:hypothetical protein